MTCQRDKSYSFVFIINREKIVRNTMPYISRFMWKRLFLIEVEMQLVRSVIPTTVDTTQYGNYNLAEKKGVKGKRGNSNTQDWRPS